MHICTLTPCVLPRACARSLPSTRLAHSHPDRLAFQHHSRCRASRALSSCGHLACARAVAEKNGARHCILLTFVTSHFHSASLNHFVMSLPTSINFNGTEIPMWTYDQLEQQSRKTSEQVRTCRRPGPTNCRLSLATDRISIDWILTVQCAVCAGKGSLSPRICAPSAAYRWLWAGEAMPRSQGSRCARRCMSRRTPAPHMLTTKHARAPSWRAVATRVPTSSVRVLLK